MTTVWPTQAPGAGDRPKLPYTPAIVKSSLEALEGNKVKLYVEIEEQEVAEAVDEAWVEIAKEVRLPGFRKGKVPVKVIKARMDAQVARAEAMRDLIPQCYIEAAADEGVEPLSEPELNVTDGEESGPIEFEATVSVRPQVELTGFASIRVEVPSPTPSDDDVSDRIDQLRGNFAELNEVERPAADGDMVTIDLKGTRDGEDVPGLVVDDYSYQVGSGFLIPELDEALTGAEAGAELTFEGAHPGEPDGDPVDYTVTVKDIKERVLPELTDEFVADATEFDTIAEFRDDIVERMTNAARNTIRMRGQSGLSEQLAEMVTEEIPDELVGSTLREQLDDLVRRLAAQGMELERYLQMTGQEPEVFFATMRAEAEGGAKLDLALRAVAKAQGLEATDEDLDEEIEHLAYHAEVEPAEARVNLRRNGHLMSVRSDVTKRNAMKWLIETVEFVDPAGNPIDRDLVRLEEHDHDHDDEDHDHGDHDGLGHGDHDDDHDHDHGHDHHDHDDDHDDDNDDDDKNGDD